MDQLTTPASSSRHPASFRMTSKQPTMTSMQQHPILYLPTTQ